MSQSPRLLILGAHPDDAEFHAGGLIAIYRLLGRDVKIVSVTDGAAGHHELSRCELAARRQLEATAVAELIGTQYEVWDFPDGELQPTLEVRHRIIAEIRHFAPDLVLTHRTSDYHPDHRAVGQAVQDASFMVTVPLSVPAVPALRRDPVVAYMADHFTRPRPFEPDVAIDVGPYLDQIVAMLDCHRTQVYEWLPFNLDMEAEVPGGKAERIAWLAAWYRSRPQQFAEKYRDVLMARYGASGKNIEYAEAFEISEYAASPSDDDLGRLFPLRGE